MKCVWECVSVCYDGSSVRQPLCGFLCQIDENRSGLRAQRLAF